ncbi:hypothetical protein FNV43_RR19390 [Rhamnella rubrinervis]|uniref:Uncharacterized protein n=1 Tax=Rhamnella rubrinervis TaxID=2594499 RepID=A0A8K0GSD1_9ROSA|nr:hypothetical protein FNV43_RR19390 [Rhamnella rubrinervis]
MELSRFSDLHFIQAAQDDLLVRTLNVTCGRPVLKFKKLTDIKDDIEGLDFDSSGVKIESPRMSSGGKGIIKSDPEVSEFSCSDGGDNGRNSVMEDLDFGNTTLKQLKERRKEKKRKHSECIDLNRETDIKCSRVKQEYSNFESDEDELDLMEPLYNWKSKLTKNKKAKSQCLKKHVLAPFGTASSVIKSVDIPSLQDFLHSKGDLSATIDNKKEVLELVDCSDYENSSSLICDNQLGSCGLVPEEVSEIAAECILGTQAEDPEICVVNEAYYECMHNCSTNSVHIVSACGDIKKDNDPEIISHNLSVSEPKGDEYVTHPICDDLFQEPISSTNDHSFGVHDGHKSFSINHETQWQIDSDCVVQVPDMTTNNFDQFVEASGSDACSLEDDSSGDLPSNLETNALHSVIDCSLGSNRCLISSVGDSPVAEVKESQRLDSDDAERSFFPEILHHDASEEFTTIIDDDVRLKHLPQRFLSTRTVSNIKKVDVAERIIQEKELPEIAAECSLGTGTEDPQICVVNEAYYEHVDNCRTESVHIVSALCRVIDKVDDPEIISHNLSVSESKEEEYVTYPICDDLFQEPISSTNDHNFGMHDGHQSFSINCKMQCQIDSDGIVQVPDMITNNFDQFMEASGSDGFSHEDDSRDALHGSVGDCSLGSNHCFVSSAGDSPVAEEKESLRPNCGVDAEGNCFSEILYHDASKEFTTTVDAGLDDCSEPKCSPIRLFPIRKAISPSSQEKLCKAMESVELHDEEHYEYSQGGKEKLCIAKETQNKTKIHRTEGPDRFRRIRYSIKPKHIVMKKTKDEKRDSHPEGIPKVPNILPAEPHVSTECASIEWCSQSAIAFSERQMQDIECLAAKLRNELKTMKEIAEERLWFEEAYPATSLKYDASKVRMAIKNVKRAEQSAQRWISMMARDCSRFCKIMKLTETGSVAPKGAAKKVRKNVTFADEAGKKLCDVRIF